MGARQSPLTFGVASEKLAGNTVMVTLVAFRRWLPWQELGCGKVCNLMSGCACGLSVQAIRGVESDRARPRVRVEDVAKVQAALEGNAKWQHDKFAEEVGRGGNRGVGRGLRGAGGTKLCVLSTDLANGVLLQTAARGMGASLALVEDGGCGR
jgi:hypothetical protein